jgi:hypothetical protein
MQNLGTSLGREEEDIMIVEAMEQEISQFAVCNIIINNTN